MTNPIPKSSFFATPRDYEDLAVMINEIGTPEEQRLAWLGASLALNLSHKLLEEFIKERVE